jgi:hypothetical protein
LPPHTLTNDDNRYTKTNCGSSGIFKQLKIDNVKKLNGLEGQRFLFVKRCYFNQIHHKLKNMNATVHGVLQGKKDLKQYRAKRSDTHKGCELIMVVKKGLP